MTTWPERAALTEAAPLLAAPALPGAPVERLPGSSPGEAGAALQHSFPLTAATLDRPRASDVAAPPPQWAPGSSRAALAGNRVRRVAR
jgi:hypothetical protein